MKQHNCLNCETQLTGKFCSECGQKSDTHRITLKHFIMHDLLHGIWHFEKGMLFTAKEALLRPGKAALDYIGGKRIPYYNVFYFILLLIGLNIFINHHYDQLYELYYAPNGTFNNEVGNKLELFLKDYAKILIFSFVPLFAVNGFLIFRRHKLNLSEHFIVAGIIFLGILIITTVVNLLSYFDFTKSFQILSDTANTFTPVIILLYMTFGYYSAFRAMYGKFGFTVRMVLFILLLSIELTCFLLFIFGYVTHWEFGKAKYQI